MAYSELAISYAPWSLSKVGTLEQCRKQFLHKYVEKVPEESKSTQARLGVVLHEVLESAIRMPGLSTESLFKDFQEKHALSEEERIEGHSRIAEIDNFLTRLVAFKQAQGIKEEYVEQKLAINETNEPVKFFDKTAFLRGVLDYGARTADDYLILIDHKSGKRKKIEEHGTQFYLYMVMAVANYPWLKGVQSGINYIGEPRIDWYPRLDGSSGAWSKQEILTRVVPWLSHYVNNAAKHLGTNEYPAKPSWACSFCGYVSLCPEGQKEVAKRKNKSAKPLDV